MSDDAEKDVKQTLNKFSEAQGIHNSSLRNTVLRLKLAEDVSTQWRLENMLTSKLT